MFKLLALLVALVGYQSLALAASPSASAELRQYYVATKSLSGHFTQVTVRGDGSVAQRSDGDMAMERPNRFDWTYDTPYKQKIVADGRHLWVYDEDLEQVTERPLNSALGAGPALLLSSDYSALQKQFQISDEADRGWVRLVPSTKDWDFKWIRLKMAGGVPRVIELRDDLGQTTRLTLSGLKRNPSLPASLFEFSPPPGVDVIRAGGARGQ